jgi:hypothetical protein
MEMETLPLTKVCDTCGRERLLDRFNDECRNPETCFACRVSTLGVSYQGGKEFFHNDTVASSVKRMTSEFTENNNGLKPVPKTPQGTGGMATRNQEAKLKKALGG